VSARPAAERREELIALMREMQQQHDCPLIATRTKLVFGAGNADADLMFVGEAPGFYEDQQGLPFVGRAGKLLDQLLVEMGMQRRETFVTNTLKCLRYNTPVQLADGRWERIVRLVRSRYQGEVMSVDDRGAVVPRRVVGWHATPLGERRVFRLTYGTARRVGNHRVCTTLTGDHPVLTERGYVPVAELEPGERVAIGQGLTELAWDVTCGTLLGDGSLNARSAHLHFAHSRRQLEYATLKAGLLDELSPRMDERRAAAVAGGPRSYEVVLVRTLASRALRRLRGDFYTPKKVVPEWMAGALNARMLAFWFMDDGYTRIRPGGRQPLAEIATNAFSDRDRRILQTGLLRIGLPAKTSRARLYFDVQATRQLSRAIAPFVPPSMRYKLHPEVEGEIPFDERKLEPGQPRVLYDEAEVEDITDETPADRTWFCIDVEGTHNFVTPGGVVHNCRPPDNRDPLPDEIDVCKPYLFRQIELIEPKVVCTLGNFSLKLLTRSNTGITRVHGVPQEHELGGRRVKLYPLFHPAAALRGSAVLDQLREDMGRLPGLLAEPALDKPEPPPDPASQLDLFG